jgi:hypothetical protein
MSVLPPDSFQNLREELNDLRQTILKQERKITELEAKLNKMEQNKH